MRHPGASNASVSSVALTAPSIEFSNGTSARSASPRLDGDDRRVDGRRRDRLDRLVADRRPKGVLAEGPPWAEIGDSHRYRGTPPLPATAILEDDRVGRRVVVGDLLAGHGARRPPRSSSRRRAAASWSAGPSPCSCRRRRSPEASRSGPFRRSRPPPGRRSRRCRPWFWTSIATSLRVAGDRGRGVRADRVVSPIGRLDEREPVGAAGGRLAGDPVSFVDHLGLVEELGRVVSGMKLPGGSCGASTPSSSRTLLISGAAELRPEHVARVERLHLLA